MKIVYVVYGILSSVTNMYSRSIVTLRPGCAVTTWSHANQFLLGVLFFDRFNLDISLYRDPYAWILVGLQFTRSLAQRYLVPYDTQSYLMIMNTTMSVTRAILLLKEITLRSAVGATLCTVGMWLM